MKILWITWKDMQHPEAGGAEVVCHELTKRLLKNGHEVTLLTSDYEGAKEKPYLKGLKIIRRGRSRYSHPFVALWYYLRHLRNKYDIVIEEVNGGAPYFAVFFGRKSKRYLLYHQLARKNWLYEIKAPFSYLGYYVLVPLATWLVGLSRAPVITVSESTRQRLDEFGIPKERTHIISEGIQTLPIGSLGDDKYSVPTILSHGGMRAMKRTIDQIEAFELAKQSIPALQMKISGSSSGEYGRQVLARIAKSPYAHDIEYLGRTTEAQRNELMQKCHAILVTSVEEGWGLIVTEANSQGTPAVVYDVDGLRDSVKHGETGIVAPQDPQALAHGIRHLLHDSAFYHRLRKNAWKWSHQITFEKSHEDFKKVLAL